MKNSEKKWSQSVFKRSTGVDLSQTQTAIDVELSNVFWAIDGQRSLGDIAAEGNYPLRDLLGKVQHLVQLGLIEASPTETRVVSQSTMHDIIERLSKVIGPMSHILITDTAEALGYTISDFPAFKLPELANRITAEIGDTEKAEAFLKDIQIRIQGEAMRNET